VYQLIGLINQLIENHLLAETGIASPPNKNKRPLVTLNDGVTNFALVTRNYWVKDCAIQVGIRP